MRSNRNRASGLGFLFALSALAGTTAAPTPAGAFEAKLWPLADVRQHEDGTHVSILGPLIEWRSDVRGSLFAMRPLFYTAKDAESGRRTGSFLYPIATWDGDGQSFLFRLFGLATYSSTRVDAPGAEGSREIEVFPLVFFRSDPETGTSLSVLPLYANLEHFFGYERVRMLLFPLYLRLDQPLWHRTFLPFPFVSWLGGRAGSGLRLWPLWGRTIEGSERETRYLLWPLWIRQVEHPGRPDAVTTRISWPFFSTIDGTALESRSYSFLPLVLLPLYTHTVDRRHDREITGFPWPAAVVEHERSSGKRLSLRLAPLYQDRTGPVLRSRFVLWPLYRHRQGREEDAAYDRTDVLFFLYRSQHEGEGETALATDVALPLWISRIGRNSGRAQSLTLVDGIFPKNEKLETLYAPLYRLYGEERAAGGTRRDVAWRLWEWGDGNFRPPWYLSTGP